MIALAGLVLAAGAGTRATASGLVGPKAMLRVGGQSVLGRLMTQLERSRVVDAVVIAVRPEERAALEHVVNTTIAMPTTFVECSTASSIETLQLGLHYVDTPAVTVVAADLIARSEELIGFLVESMEVLAADSSIMGVQPISAGLQSSTRRLGVDSDGCLSRNSAGTSVMSEGPRVFATAPLRAALELSDSQDSLGVWELVEKLLHTGWRMRGVPLRPVMDIDDRSDLALARRLIDDGTLDCVVRADT